MRGRCTATEAMSRWPESSGQKRRPTFTCAALAPSCPGSRSYLAQLAARREQRHLERLPGDLPVQRLVQAALDLGAHRGRVDQRGREQHEQHGEEEYRHRGVSQAFHGDNGAA